MLEKCSVVIWHVYVVWEVDMGTGQGRADESLASWVEVDGGGWVAHTYREYQSK